MQRSVREAGTAAAAIVSDVAAGVTATGGAATMVFVATVGAAGLVRRCTWGIFSRCDLGLHKVDRSPDTVVAHLVDSEGNF